MQIATKGGQQLTSLNDIIAKQKQRVELEFLARQPKSANDILVHQNRE